MELTNVMIEAGAEYLCGYSKEKAIKLEEEDEFQACCNQAKEIFNVMLNAAIPAGDLQKQLAEGEPVNNNPSMW